MSIARYIFTIAVNLLILIDLTGQCSFQKYVPYIPISGPKIIKTSDNYYVVVFGGRYDTLDPDWGNTDECVVKLDTCGNVMWRKHYGHPTQVDHAYNIVEADNGDYLILGVAAFQQSGINIRVRRLNKNGDTVWDKLYPDTKEGISGDIFVNRGKGSYIVSGQYSIPKGTKSEYYGYIFEINEIGDLLREKKIPADSIFSRLNIGRSFHVNSNDYYFIAKNNNDILIINTDSNLNIRWMKNPVPLFFNYLYNIYDACLSDDSSSIIILADGIPKSGGKFSGGFIKTDLLGNLLKIAKLPDSMTYPSFIIPYNKGYIVNSALTFLDSNFNITGTTETPARFSSFIYNGQKSITGVSYNIQSNKTYPELYIARTDDNGFMVNAPVIENKAKEKISVYPNPAQEELNVEIQTSASLRIINTEGKTLKTLYVEKGKQTLHIAEPPQGLYLLQWQSEAGVYHTKFVKE